MSKRWILGVAVILYSIASAGGAVQEQADQPQWYFLVEEQVKPSMMMEYEEATKQIIREMQAYEVSPEKVSFSAISGPELGYVYVMPIDNFGHMDTKMADWQEVVSKIGAEKWAELEARSDKCVDHRATFHVVQRADLSFQPESPAVPQDEVKTIVYGFYYVMPGKERQLESVARRYAELYREHGLDNAWTIYQSVTGGDLPLYVVAHPARSTAEFHKRSEEIDELLGEAGKKLGEEAMACVRRIEIKDGYLRPDLSYPPGN
ncbi:MAG: hypothetical protein ACYTGC_06415 [Planctomycetota bacterium]|jgi:hypothetical protein